MAASVSYLRRPSPLRFDGRWVVLVGFGSASADFGLASLGQSVLPGSYPDCIQA
jgi:hypothetical protein